MILNQMLSGMAWTAQNEPSDLPIDGRLLDEAEGAVNVVRAMATRIAVDAMDKSLSVSMLEQDRMYNIGRLSAIRELCAELRSALNAYNNPPKGKERLL